MKTKYLTLWPLSPGWSWEPRPSLESPGQGGVALGRATVPPRSGRWVTPSCQLMRASHWGHDSFRNSDVHVPAATQSLAQGPQRNNAQPPAKHCGPLGGRGHRDPQSWLILRQSRREAGRLGSGARLLRSESQLRHRLATCLGTANPHTVPSAPQAGLLSIFFPATSPAPARPTLSKHLSSGCRVNE